MKTTYLICQLQEYKGVKHLSAPDQHVLRQAAQTAYHAYAPYSNFRVGAAVLLKNGKIILGNNQENCAYPSGLCAERVALFAASAQFPGVPIKTIAITYKISSNTGARKNHFMIFNSIITPCGACRQVIAEYEKKQKNPIKIIMGAPKGNILIVEGIGNLLPIPFAKTKNVKTNKIKPKP